MGQYFQYFNLDMKEYVDLPGGMKAIERVSNPVAMGVVGYLLLQGPQDGTKFLYDADPEDERLQEGINERMEREADLEVDSATDPKRWERYFERATSNAELGDTRDDVKRDAAEMMAGSCRSVYRDRETYEWDRKSIARTVAAGFDIDEFNIYAGRWAGDRVALIGDYDDSGTYSERYGTIVAEDSNGEEIEWTGGHPRKVIPCWEGTDCCDDPGQYVSHHVREDAQMGDWVRAPSRDDVDDDFVQFIRYIEGDWTNITEHVTAEFAEFVGEEWLEAQDSAGLLRPDMIIEA